MKFIRRYHRFICILVFPVLAWMFVNSTINRHSHIIRGSIISHAHPYEKDTGTNSPFQSHKHSEDELILFDLISNYMIVLTGVLFIPVFLNFIKEVITIPRITVPVIDSVSLQPYRGPPAII